MNPLSIKDVINAVDGCLIAKDKNIDLSSIFIKGVSTDTRNIKIDDLFIPLKGNNFDGHKFINMAFEKGAVCTLSEDETENLYNDKIIIKVKSTKQALMDLAQFYRSLFDIPVVAITGSAGKTTTKDIIASVLSQKYNVLKTEGNFNNEIGLPLTVFKIDNSTEVVVLEMGMNHFGEIHNLSKIAVPDVAVITNIGVSHIENLGSREGILKAKCEIFDYLSSLGIIIVNGDDDMLNKINDNKHKIYKYGLKYQNEFYADEIEEKGIEGIKCQIHTPENFFYVNIPVPGKHTIYNSLAAAGVGICMGLSKEEIKNGIENFQPTKMRMNIIKTKRYSIINDVYNSNPSSVKAGIDVISSVKGRKVCILGDMLELGNFSNELHREIGEYAVSNNIDIIICIGTMSKYMFEGACKMRKNENQRIYYFETQEDFFCEMNNIINKNDTILVKASRGMKFEKTIEKITG